MSREIIEEACKEIGAENPTELAKLIETLLDEESQIAHQVIPRKILAKLASHVEDYVKE